MARKISLGPINRVEGDLEIQLTLAENKIASAQVNSTLYRGFENLLSGKVPMDALAITPRVCGICSVSQSVAAAKAIGNFGQIPMAENGQHVTNILLATEIVADILTHFYLFFMPDFTDKAYEKMPWAERVNENFTAVSGNQHASMLKARAEFLHIMGILAGKWPHSMVFQPGGVSKAVTMSEQMTLLGIVSNFKIFLEQVLYGDKLENIVTINNSQDLNDWQNKHAVDHSDLSLFLNISQTLNLSSAGASQNQLLAFPAFEENNTALYQGGVAINNSIMPLDTKAIIEHHDFAKLYGKKSHPSQGITQPDIHKEQAYSWCKAPRYNNQVMETGSLARQFISGDSLAQSLVNENGTNVHNRIVLRLVELAKLVHKIEHWIKAIKPNQAFCNHQALPEDGFGVGLSEAARGALGHWFSVENGKVTNYQLIAPTSWNFSPRDNLEQPGALEFALAGMNYQSEQDKQMMQHVIRSFDPCMLCTVH